MAHSIRARTSRCECDRIKCFFLYFNPAVPIGWRRGSTKRSIGTKSREKLWRKQINSKTRKNHKHKPCVHINYATREFTWCVLICSSTPTNLGHEVCAMMLPQCRLGCVPSIPLVSVCYRVPSWHALSFCSNLINTHSSLGAEGLFHISSVRVVRLYLKCTAQAVMFLSSSSPSARILHNLIIAPRAQTSRYVV